MKKPKEEKEKLKVAIHSVTGCAGCQLEIYFIPEILELIDNVDLVAAPMIKEKNSEGPYDIVFIEGVIVNEEDLENVKKWREQSKILVAIGSCAVDGDVVGIKNFTDKKAVENYVYPSTEQLKAIDPSPLSKYVKVDYFIKGCPMDKIEFLNFIKKILSGKTPHDYTNPLCIECNFRENYCLLEQGRECLGPVIEGNCSVMCPSWNLGCTGCRGYIDDSNLDEMLKLLKKKGFDEKRILERFHKYAGLKYEELKNKK